MAGHEVGLLHQVGGTDVLLAETQVRGGHGAGLLGVVDEVGLGVVAGLFADDLDGVLVGADGAVGTEAEEHRLVDAFHRVLVGVVHLQAAVGNVFLDADHELVLRLGGLEVVEAPPWPWPG